MPLARRGFLKSVGTATAGRGVAPARGAAAGSGGRAGRPLRGAAARAAGEGRPAMIGEEVLFSGIREIGAHLRAKRISAVALAAMSLRRPSTVGPGGRGIREV